MSPPPCPPRKRLAGAAVGLLVLHVVNFLRVVSLYLIGNYRPELFEEVHVVFWQTVMIFVALVIWAVWERWAAKG